MPLEPAEFQFGEDFVHVADPRPPGDISLSESIVYVEKEKLLAEREVKEEDHSDSGSVITGVDPVCDCGGIAVEKTKLELPEELAKSVMVLTCESTEEGGSCDVYLVGTAHVSQVYSFFT